MHANNAQANVRSKVIGKIVRTMSEFHFESPKIATLDEKLFLPRNLSLMALTYIFDSNHLLMGDAGTGKSTSSKIVSAMFSGVPYDVFHKVEMRGHAGQVEEKLIGRLDYSSLNSIEKVKWMGSILLPVLNADEVNRLSEEVQGALFQGIETGVWSYAGSHSYAVGKFPAFLTANYRDEGTYRMLQPLKDRMDIVTESQFQQRSGLMTGYSYSDAESAVARVLCNPDASKEAVKMLNEKGADEFVKFISDPKNMLPMVSPLTQEEKLAAREEIVGIKDIYEVEEAGFLSGVLGKGKKMVPVNDPALFLEAFEAEINFSEKFGSKRSTDPASERAHDKNYVGHNVHTGFSGRSKVAAGRYAKGLAWLRGKKNVGLDDITEVLPHVVAHKFVFTEQFRKEHGNDARADMEALNLAQSIVKGAAENYNKAAGAIKDLLAKLASIGESGNVDELAKLEGRDYDHPYMKVLIRTAIDKVRIDDSLSQFGGEEGKY